MKIDNIFKSLYLILGIIFLVIIINKINNYFDAQISYKLEECNDRAYIIYKEHDDQEDEFKTRDWGLRLSECGKIEAKYKQRFK